MKTPPEPMLLVKHTEAGPNLTAQSPGSWWWELFWGKTENGREQLIIQFDDEFWGPNGDRMVLVDGESMTRRQADVLHLCRRIQQIADRGEAQAPVQFR